MAILISPSHQEPPQSAAFAPPSKARETLPGALHEDEAQGQRLVNRVSAEVADWAREHKAFWQWQPARSLIAALRSYQSNAGSTRWDRVVLRRLAVVQHRFWSAVSGADIPLTCRIDGGLLMPHSNGIVIHPDARIGPNCLIMQQVTLGTGGPIPGVPTLAGHVDVGAGAKILGGVSIGAHAVIGANAVVICDVPENALAVGVPARILRRPGSPLSRAPDSNWGTD